MKLPQHVRHCARCRGGPSLRVGIYREIMACKGSGSWRRKTQKPGGEAGLNFLDLKAVAARSVYRQNPGQRVEPGFREKHKPFASARCPSGSLGSLTSLSASRADEGGQIGRE